MYQVMLVDDSKVSLKEIKRLPIWRETPVFLVSGEACNGYEALLKLADAPVDLVITDIRMPKVNGLELLQKIMERELAKTVVLLSEYQEFSYARRGMVLGAFDYLVKPVGETDFKKLLVRVAQHLKETDTKKRQLQQLEKQVANNAGTNYLGFEIRKLVEFVMAGSFQAEIVARNLVRIVSETRNLVKTVIVVQTVIAEIASVLEQRCPWVDKFINLELVRGAINENLPDVERLTDIFVHLVVFLVSRINKLTLGNAGNSIVKKTCRYTLEHIGADLTIQSLAEALSLHRSYLSEVFKQQTGQRVSDYIIMVKLEWAKKLLWDGQLLTCQIAERLGYQDAEYFSRLFKKYTGVAPSRYKKNIVTII
jgi:two-component system response regulator YesN